jgi:cell division protein FtsI/penicillin-binding protein 2
MKNQRRKDPDTAKRIKFVLFLLILFAAFLAIRLFFIQIISGDYYEAQAARQQNFSQIIAPRRGNIYLKTKTGELATLATTKEGYLLYINPRILKNPEDSYEQLNAILPIEKEDFLERASKKEDPYEVIAHKIERDTKSRIEDLRIEGVGTAAEEWRNYPGKNLASHVLGFLGYSEEVLEGRYGLERYFDDILQGEEGYLNGTRSAGGSILELGRNLLSPPKEGYDLVLTLEPNAQAFLEKKLVEIEKAWRPQRGGAIILEPKTGKILAMAAFPNFDPNSYGKIESLETFINPLVENVFEFGSVFKPLTLAAALNENIITPQTTYYDKGYLTLDDYTIKNFDEKGRGEVTMQKVLEESLNTGAAFVAQRLGKENMRKYFLSYGLGEKTGVTLPGEVKGNTSNLYSGREVEYATASFGQGISTTPLAFATAAASLANGGKIMKPYLVERIVRPGKEDILTKPEAKREILSTKTSETISKMLVKVVEDALLGGGAELQNWTWAAKTGTAQIPLKDAKGYSQDSLHSFFGYAPAFDPKFLVFLYLEKPQGVKYAAYSLGPYSKEIIQFLLTYYEIPPDK